MALTNWPAVKLLAEGLAVPMAAPGGRIGSKSLEIEREPLLQEAKVTISAAEDDKKMHFMGKNPYRTDREGSRSFPRPLVLTRHLRKTSPLVAHTRRIPITTA